MADSSSVLKRAQQGQRCAQFLSGDFRERSALQIADAAGQPNQITQLTKVKLPLSAAGTVVGRRPDLADRKFRVVLIHRA
ncbi:MAG: hypothetical protein IPK63_08395 [Candidatus Competibacteraceae bacterium]|nr:hypothetical protein [Candidatus Competibacteraceae bacterium]